MPCRKTGRGRKRHNLTTFKDLGLASSILDALLAEGYETPTPIQVETIPVTMSGRDVLGIAQTGTGKTAAFVLPQLNAMANGRKGAPARSATVLILAPTRELAAQIAEAIETYGRALKPSVVTVIGGVKAGPQARAMARGADFLVATPGRLLDHMQTGAVTLSGVKTMVLDEADQMLDLGFMPALRKILEKLPAQRQMLLFSATMPKLIRKLASEFLRNPAEISVAPVSKPIERIEQSVVFVEKTAKPRLLAKLLKDGGEKRAIVFTRTKHGANRLCQQLDRSGIEAQPIHGNKSQNQREKTLAAFRDGSLSVLVATDIAARGIDIDDVSHVYNYDLPNVAEVYVHRIGRTARAGRSGQAVAFCDATERPLLRDIEKLTGLKLPVAAHDLGAPAPRDEAEASAGQREARAQGAGKPGLNGEGRKRRRNRTNARPAGETRNATADRAPGAKPAPAKTAGEAGAKSRKRRRRKPAASTPANEAGLQRMLGNIGIGA